MAAEAGNLWLLLSISASWVGVAQLARAAEERTEQLQQQSAVPLMTWANATAWIVLATPYMLRRSRSGGGATAGETMTGISAFLRLLQTEAFRSPRQPAQFWIIALTTNLAYMSALHFLPASLNTAIFCTSPIFTLLLSAVFLSTATDRLAGKRSLCNCLSSELCTRKALSVVLSVVGVILIVEPWQASAVAGSALARLTGAGLSLFAALGTAIYQVYFKVTFGDLMRPEEVGLFLAHIGAMSSAIVGAALVGLVAGGIYPIELELVPWTLIGSTALSSAVFNLLIKIGLSRDSPVSVSLATQIGIPMNLFLDVIVVRAPVRGMQVAGTAAMLASFTLSAGGAAGPAGPASPPAGARLLDGRAET